MLKKYFTEEEYNSLQASNDLLFKTLELVIKLFEGKTDKGGLPYLNHLMKVYAGVSDYQEKIIALLHDVVEDTDVTYEDLKEFGYSEDIIEALTYLTKKKGEYYKKEIIDRIDVKTDEIDINNFKRYDIGEI